METNFDKPLEQSLGNILKNKTLLWSGDIHSASSQTITLTESYKNFIFLLFVFNVIPSRTPAFDIVTEGYVLTSMIPADSSSVGTKRMDITSPGSQVYITLQRESDTSFSMQAYGRSRTDTYYPGLVKIYGIS